MDTTAFASPTYAAFSRMVRVQTALWRAVDLRLREHHDIALADVTALQVVGETGGTRVQDLAATLHITVGGASKVVDRLVASGLAQRAPHPTDRRSSVVTSTGAGRRVLDRTSTDVEAVLGEKLGGVLGTSELARLDELLRLLEDSVVAIPDGTVA